MKRFATLCIVFTFCSFNTQSEKAQDLKTQIIGSWEGKGTLFGRDASFSMQWDEVYEGKFLRLQFKNEFTDKAGTLRKMQASGHYALAQERGFWIDSRGTMLPLKTQLTTDVLVVFWGDDESAEKGKTVYKLLGEDQIEVKDFVIRETDTIPFGAANYTRLKD